MGYLLSPNRPANSKAPNEPKLLSAAGPNYYSNWNEWLNSIFVAGDSTKGKTTRNGTTAKSYNINIPKVAEPYFVLSSPFSVKIFKTNAELLKANDTPITTA